MVTRYHIALLLTRSGQFEAALEVLMKLAEQGIEGPDFVEAAGLAALRKPLLPKELPPMERELVLQVGHAVTDTGARRAAEAQKKFEDLLARHPKTPHLHYLFGSFLLTSNPDAGLHELKKELELCKQKAPGSPQTRFALASAYAKAGRKGDAARERIEFLKLEQLTKKPEEP